MTMITNSSSVPGDPLEIARSYLGSDVRSDAQSARETLIKVRVQ